MRYFNEKVPNRKWNLFISILHVHKKHYIDGYIMNATAGVTEYRHALAIDNFTTIIWVFTLRFISEKVNGSTTSGRAL